MKCNLSTFNVIQNFIRPDDSQPDPDRPDDFEPDPGARSPKIGLARSGSGRPGPKAHPWMKLWFTNVYIF